VVVVPVAKKEEVTPVPLATKSTIPVATKAADTQTVTSTTTTKTKWFRRPRFGLKGEAIIAALKFKFHKGVAKAKVIKDKVI
jgi:hypothetical protein